jgi:hypothetical protein
MVAKDSSHQQMLKKGLIEAGMNEDDIFIITGQQSLYLTDDTVEQGEKDYKVVISRLDKSTGYTLSRLKAMITCVYPSNVATREQLEGRINRIGQRAKSIRIEVVMAGILENIHKKHKHAKNLLSVLETLSTEIKYTG